MRLTKDDVKLGPDGGYMGNYARLTPMIELSRLREVVKELKEEVNNDFLDLHIDNLEVIERLKVCELLDELFGEVMECEDKDCYNMCLLAGDLSMCEKCKGVGR